MWNRFAARRANLVLNYRAPKSSFTIADRGSYESRNAATTHLLIEALGRCKGKISRSFSLPILTDDFVHKPPRVPHAAYCTDGALTNTIAIPDFIFWSWPQVGIADYEQTADRMLAAGERAPDDPRLFWIGNSETHPTRARFLQLVAGDPRIHAVGVTWVRGSDEASTAPMQTAGNRYVTLEDHCRYRYLIDLEGRGYSGRVKLLLFSGRPLFLQERRWREYFYADLVPFVHYIPVGEDLSDLGEKLDWADANPERAREIAANARQFACSHLRREHAIDFLARQLVSLANGSRSLAPAKPL